MKTLEKADITSLQTFDFTTITGNTLRVIFDTETKLIEIVVDHKILAALNQIELQPVVLAKGFYED